MNCLKLSSFCLSILLTFPCFCTAGSISIEGGSGRITIDGIDTDKIESINVNTGTNSGCVEGSGVKSTQKREVAQFNKIDISGVFDVNIECQIEKSVEVTSDDNILPYVTTEVKGKTLYVTSNKSICPKSGLEVNVSIENIERVSAVGATDIVVYGIDNKALEVDLDGSGDIKASGKTKEFIANVSGAVDLDAEGLLSETVQVSVDGASDVVVYASKRLKAVISGVGDIYCHGNPEEIIEDISGVGEIIIE